MKNLLNRYSVQIVFGISFIIMCATLGLAIKMAHSGEKVPTDSWIFETFALSVAVSTFSGLILMLKGLFKH